MVLTRNSVIGIENREGTAAEAVLSFKHEKKSPALIQGDKKMEKKIYKVIIPNFVEKGVVHSKGQSLQVEIDETRAANLVNAGYIEEVLPEAQKPEVKAIPAAPQDKMIKAGDSEIKTATGFVAKLKEKKNKK